MAVTDAEILKIVSGCKDGTAQEADFLRHVFPDQRSEFTSHQLTGAKSSLSLAKAKGLLECSELQVQKKKRGPADLELVWRLTDAGRHNLMTRSTGATARNILDEIDAED